MSDRVPAPQPPIFNLQAYSPAEIKEAVEKVGVKKANLPPFASFMLAIVAGGGIGFGALYYTIVASDAELSFAIARVVGGLVFSLGLALVLVGVASGATGNPAILVYSTKMAPTERPDIGYAMIFPSMTLVKVIAAQIVGLLATGGAGG